MSTSAISSMRSLVKTAIGNIKEATMDKPDHGEFTPPPSLKSDVVPQTDTGSRSGTSSSTDQHDTLSVKNQTHEPLPAASVPLADRNAPNDDDFEIDPVKEQSRPAQSPFAGFLNRSKGATENNGVSSVNGNAKAGGVINRKKLMAVLMAVVVLAIAFKFMFAGGPDSEQVGASATVAAEADKDVWTSVPQQQPLADLNTPPFGDQERIPPELLSGAERERQTQYRVNSGEIKAAVSAPTSLAQDKLVEDKKSTSPAEEAPHVAQTQPIPTNFQTTLDDIKASTSKTEGAIETIGKRIDAIEKDVASIKAKNEAASKAKAKAEEKPKLLLKAITRTPNCSSCRPFALVDTGSDVKQVGQGDSLLGYRVSVDDDRMILSKGNLQHSYHLKDGF